MALSSWPENSPSDSRKTWKQPVPLGKIVTLDFGENVQCEIHTPDAIGIRFLNPRSRNLVFIPKSQLPDPAPTPNAFISRIRLPRWLAEKKDLEMYIVDEE